MHIVEHGHGFRVYTGMKCLASASLGIWTIIASAADTAAGWELKRDDNVWSIDERTGGVRSMALGEVRMLGAGYDKYSLPTVTNAYQGSERDDEIIKVDDRGLPSRLVLHCENRDLKLQLEKTYYFDPEMDWFCKRVMVSAPKQEKGFLVISAGVKCTTDLWNGAVIHHPGSHGHSQTNLRTDRVEDTVELRNSDGSGMVCLSNPTYNQTLTTMRFAGGDQPVFFTFNPKFSGFPVPDGKGGLVDYKVPGLDRMWSAASPGRWEMPYLYGPVGNGITERLDSTVAYAVTEGNYADFCATYATRKNVREMLNSQPFDRPRWVSDIVMSDWEDTQVTGEKSAAHAGRAWKRILDRMWFGHVVIVNYGYFVNSWGYPANNEEWAENYITISESGQNQGIDHYRKWLQGQGKNPDEYVLSSDEKFYVTRNPWKPHEFTDSRRKILEAAGHHSRLKIGDYTHTGHTGFDRTAQILKDHPDIATYRRNGEVYSNAADYSGDWNNPIGVCVNQSHPVVQKYWTDRCRERIRNLGIDFYYIDSFCYNVSFVDWKSHSVTQDEDGYPLWQRLVEVCREEEVPIWHNNPFASYNDIGYSEHPWFATWQIDWRMWASRQMAHNAMNPRGRPILLVGERDGTHYEDLLDATSAPMRLFSPILWNARMSFNNFGHMFPDRQATFTIRSLPWIQAGYELRMRTFARPDVRPRWWAYETDLEAQPYQLGQSGVIAFMNHDAETGRHVITCRPVNFAEMQADQPTWVWRIDIPHPREVSYEGVSDTSPIRRLMKHSRAAFYESLPDLMNYEGDFRKDLPALLVLTQVPGLVESVDGQGCQLLLPENYDVNVTGTCDLKGSKTTLMVRNKNEKATVLVPAFEGKDNYRVSARSMTRMHNAGVLPAMKEVNYEKVAIGTANFIRIFVDEGETEFIVE